MTTDHTGTEPTEFAEPTEWTLEGGVPTLREQIEYHLGLAHKSAKDRMAMHLAIAAGIGLASCTLDDIEAAADLEAERNRQPIDDRAPFRMFGLDTRRQP